MYIARTQGRPPRGFGEVGKQRIIEGTREFLRSQSTLEISRKNIADFIGITPALISYYFPEKAALYEVAVAKPLNEHIDKLGKLAASAQPQQVRLRRLIAIFLKCTSEDLRLFDCFKSIVLQWSGYQGPNLYEQFMDRAQAALSEGLSYEDDTVIDAKFSIAALWAICKTIQDKYAAAGNPDTDASSRLPMHQELIFAFVTRRLNATASLSNSSKIVLTDRSSNGEGSAAHEATKSTNCWIC